MSPTMSKVVSGMVLMLGLVVVVVAADVVAVVAAGTGVDEPVVGVADFRLCSLIHELRAILYSEQRVIHLRI